MKRPLDEITERVWIAKAFEADLRKVVRMKKLIPGQELTIPELHGGMLIIQEGLLRELRHHEQGWRCHSFLKEGDSFRYLNVEALPGEMRPRVIAIEAATLYYVDGIHIPGMEKDHPIFFQRIMKSIDLKTSGSSLPDYLRGMEPKAMVMVLQERFPGIFSRADAGDIAQSLRLGVADLAKLLGGRD